MELRSSSPAYTAAHYDAVRNLVVHEAGQAGLMGCQIYAQVWTWSVCMSMMRLQARRQSGIFLHVAIGWGQ